MKKTSFGFIQVCNHGGEKVEYLEFQTEGRFHEHNDFEHFTVIHGAGKLITDKETIDIAEGRTYTVSPNTLHKMNPASRGLKILLSYSGKL